MKLPQMVKGTGNIALWTRPGAVQFLTAALIHVCIERELLVIFLSPSNQHCRLNPSQFTVHCSSHHLMLYKGKGKAVPLQAWSGPEGSGKLRFPDFMTTAQDGGKVVSLTHRPPLPPGNTPGTHFC